MILRSPSQILWAIFWFFWALSARRTEKRSVTREPFAKQARELAFWSAAVVLLVLPVGWLNPRVLPEPGWAATGLILQVVGMALSIWARVHLGRFWSGRVSIKVGQELIKDGPYRRVRHPIYTGLIIQMLGSSLTVGTLLAPLSVVLLYVAYRMKGQDEDNLLHAYFGEQYAHYAQATPALFPRLRPGRNRIPGATHGDLPRTPSADEE